MQYVMPLSTSAVLFRYQSETIVSHLCGTVDVFLYLVCVCVSSVKLIVILSVCFAPF